MNEFIENIKDIIRSLVRTGEQRVTMSFYNMKKKIFRFSMELLMFTVSIMFILVGFILMMDKYFPIEWVLLITGLVMLNFIFLTAKFK